MSPFIDDESGDATNTNHNMSARKNVRKRLAESSDKNYDKIEKALLEGIEAKKEHWFTCKHCNKKTQVRVMDQNARNRAVEIYLEQGFGKTVAEPTPPPEEPKLSPEQLNTLLAYLRHGKGDDWEGMSTYLRKKEGIVAEYDPAELREVVEVYKHLGEYTREERREMEQDFKRKKAGEAAPEVRRKWYE